MPSVVLISLAVIPPLATVSVFHLGPGISGSSVVVVTVGSVVVVVDSPGIVVVVVVVVVVGGDGLVGGGLVGGCATKFGWMVIPIWVV